MKKIFLTNNRLDVSMVGPSKKKLNSLSPCLHHQQLSIHTLEGRTTFTKILNNPLIKRVQNYILKSGPVWTLKRSKTPELTARIR